ncbi:rhodanese-like domain-containing protein [Jannaschia sp. R86511]|uniref:rhodanese-like domain-containing protein n=1 Tax=Jannaschia sp. R86511 TaxID=3093853 RepID=UPI0036D42F39
MLLAGLLLGACGTTGPDAADGAGAEVAPPTAEAGAAVGGAVGPEQAIDLASDGATLVDVRTPEEFAAGHVDGALNVDLQAPDFLEQVRALDPDEPYVVYCATGNRSAQAVTAMTGEGLGELYDAGGFQALADPGAPVATG